MPKHTNVARPEPVPVNVVCSLCGEAWTLHREDNGEVTTLECIRLLKAKAYRPTYVPQPYPVYPTICRGWWQTSPTITISGANTQTSPYTQAINCVSEQRTPTVALASAST